MGKYRVHADHRLLWAEYEFGAAVLVRDFVGRTDFYGVDRIARSLSRQAITEMKVIAQIEHGGGAKSRDRRPNG